jgi:alpha-tubulin suppressor-like RCC1 family protein
VVNTNGGTGIRINGLTTSPFPAWSTGTTLTGQNTAVAFAISIAATSDSNVTYSNTTVLPTGTTLAANGLFSGTVTVDTTTTYSFDVRANDAENQDASRTFSVTISVPPQTRLYSWGRNDFGQLGQGNSTYRSSPTQVGTDTNWSLVSAGKYNSMATKTNGTLWSSGRNDQGQLGLNDRVNRSSPVQIGTATNWIQLIYTNSTGSMAIATN